MKLLLALGCLGLLLLAGCAEERPAVADGDSTVSGQTPGTTAGGTEEQKTRSPEEIADLKTAYEAATAAYEKDKNDEKKGEVVKTGMAYADAMMYESDAPPREKYPEALRAYRVVVKLEPRHKEATESIDTIERIYKDMGRPVPE